MLESENAGKVFVDIFKECLTFAHINVDSHICIIYSENAEKGILFNDIFEEHLTSAHINVESHICT